MRIFTTIIIACSFFAVQAQKVWQVPVENTTQLSPFAFNKEHVEKGQKIYAKNCASCHGTPGKNNFVKLVPEPGDPASKKFKENTDGEMYFKITSGRGAMPMFKTILTPEDVWNLIAYLRTFHDGYIQKIADKIASEGATAANIELLMNYLESKKMIQVKARMADSTKKAVAGLEVKVFAKRRFGNLLLDEARITDAQGNVQFAAPKDLPGDSLGNVLIIAQTLPEGALSPITKEAKYLLGTPQTKPALTEGRHLWSKLVKIPYWLLITYLTVVLTVFGIIGYVMLMLKKIFEVGKNEIDTQE